MREECAVLVVALALLVALASLASLAAERAVLRSEILLDSALTILGARLPTSDLAVDGTPLSLPVPGGRLALQIRAASCLLIPKITRTPVLCALGSTFEQAERLALAMALARRQANRIAFRGMSQVAALFARVPMLWHKVAPFLTLSDLAETLDASYAPMALRGVATPTSAAEVDFSGAGLGTGKAIYEMWPYFEALRLDATDPQGQLWTRVSTLAGSDDRLHILALFWPQTEEGG